MQLVGDDLFGRRRCGGRQGAIAGPTGQNARPFRGDRPGRPGGYRRRRRHRAWRFVRLEMTVRDEEQQENPGGGHEPHDGCAVRRDSALVGCRCHDRDLPCI